MIRLAFSHNPRDTPGVGQNEIELEMSAVMFSAASKMLNNSCSGFPISCRNVKDSNMNMSVAYIPLIGS